MAKSIFLDKVGQPDECSLAEALGGRKLYWDEIVRHITEAYAAVTCEWKYYGKAWGWSLVLKSKAKTLCYLVPRQGHFQAAVIFNEAGRMLAAATGLPEEVARDVEASKNNPKNIPYDFNVTEQEDIKVAEELIAIRHKT